MSGSNKVAEGSSKVLSVVQRVGHSLSCLTNAAKSVLPWESRGRCNSAALWDLRRMPAKLLSVASQHEVFKETCEYLGQKTAQDVERLAPHVRQLPHGHPVH
ncbi:hypothetical protein EYF80_040334 [Liparis tanakae]|uniref:Uncharacterized protein n=1 Tax=Liparis tanakae TaxID=230148 RepID=A0A4Z2G7C5_9TELE|nr:hypothetical protein EYF80_040334 [Liparis tanakae]